MSLVTDGSIPSSPAGLSLTVELAVSLYATMKVFLDVKPPKNPNGAKDLEILQERIRTFGIAAEKEEAAEKRNGSGNPMPDDNSASAIIEKEARGALRKILNQPTKVALTTNFGYDKVSKLIKKFSAEYLTEDSAMLQVFKEHIELHYFEDRYPNKVRH